MGDEEGEQLQEPPQTRGLLVSQRAEGHKGTGSEKGTLPGDRQNRERDPGKQGWRWGAENEKEGREWAAGRGWGFSETGESPEFSDSGGK